MRIVFAGTPRFAAFILNGLILNNHKISLVLTKPDNYSGRGMKLKESYVKSIAKKNFIECIQPHTLNSTDIKSNIVYKRLLEIKPDIILVVAYGLILPEWMLSLPKFGCVNIHASLLPRWRGAAPIHRAIEHGDKVTGISIIHMNSTLDAGNIILQNKVDILPEYNTGDLYRILSIIGLKSINEVILKLKKEGRIQSYEQPNIGVTYANKIQKSESILDLSLDASELVNKIKSLNPIPGAKIKLPWFSDFVKIFSAEVLYSNSEHPIGTITSLNDKGIDISTGKNQLRLLELQKPGSKRQNVREFFNYLSSSKLISLD